MTEPEPSRVVGILGGMGPGATVDFYDKLIKATPAQSDQDHLRVIIWADPTVPNRNEALTSGGADPTPLLIRGIDGLIASGAEILVVPCNTVHAFLPQALRGKDIEFISIIEATVAEVSRSAAGLRVGLLAADGAMASGLYQTALHDAQFDVVTLDDADQRSLMRLIYEYKSGRVGAAGLRLLDGLIKKLVADGVGVVIAGCTEVSSLLGDITIPVRIIDSSQVLAAVTVTRARIPRVLTD